MKKTGHHRWSSLVGTTATCLVILSGCAKVSVTALNPNGTAKSGQAEGLRYYLPKPYLIVMRVPGGTTLAGNPQPAPVVDRAGHVVRPGAAAAAADPSKASTPPTTPASTAAAPASGNTSFQVINDQYAAKIVLLPDFKHPMAVSESGGLFGTASMAASIADGWQLTSLQGSSDAKVAETLTALASLVSAASGAATGSGAAKSAAGGKPGEAPQAATGLGTDFLPPGLYAFDDTSPGAFLPVCLVTAFDKTTPIVSKCPENGPQPGKLSP